MQVRDLNGVPKTGFNLIAPIVAVVWAVDWHMEDVSVTVPFKLISLIKSFDFGSCKIQQVLLFNGW